MNVWRAMDCEEKKRNLFKLSAAQHEEIMACFKIRKTHDYYPFS